MTFKKRKYEWRQCYKVDSGNFAEVFSDFVRIDGNNYHGLEELEDAIKRINSQLELFEEVKSIWLEKFINKRKNK